MLDHLPQHVEIVGHLLLREEAHELQAVPQFDLGDDGQRAVAAKSLQVMVDGDADTLLGAADVGQRALQRLEVVARVLAEDCDEEIFLAIEVEVDRSVGHAG